jgi:hypothetical protein
VLGHDFYYGDAVFLGRAAALPETPTRRPQKAGRTAKLFGQVFQEAVEPVLADRLAVAGLPREKAHETLRWSGPCQPSSSVSVVTVSTCSPKRFM